MSSIQAETAGLYPGLLAGGATKRETESNSVPQGVASSDRHDHSHSAPSQDRDRVMNALPPEDADRNLDFDALVAKYEKKIFNIIA